MSGSVRGSWNSRIALILGDITDHLCIYTPRVYAVNEHLHPVEKLAKQGVSNNGLLIVQSPVTPYLS